MLELPCLYLFGFSLKDTYFPANVNQAVIAYPQFNDPRISRFSVINFSKYEIYKSLGTVSCSTWFVDMLLELINVY